MERHRYHHGYLRRALLDAALEEIARSGPSRLSLREMARRAGVSHAAPAHHFRDKAGVFTAIATEGFVRLVAATSVAARDADPLVAAGLAYITFAVEHPAHFSVMWRPELYDGTDPELVAARDRVFSVFHGTVGSATDPADEARFQATVLAAWSVVHGFATLWLSGNLQEDFGGDPVAAAILMAQGMAGVSAATARALGGAGLG